MARSQAARPNQRQVRLSRPQQLELVERYRGGALQRELASTYGIERRTVGDILRRHDARPTRGLTDEQLEEAVRSYAAGRSLATIASGFGVTAHTVRRRLLERGVEMRSTAGYRS